MWQKFGDAVDGVIGDASEDVFEPGERLDIHALTRGYETAQHSRCPAADIAAKKHPVAATHRHAFVERDDWRGIGNAADLLPDCLHIVNGQSVVSRIADALPATFVFCIDPIRPDRLDLIQKVLLSGKADGGDKNQRCGPDDHAKRRESEPNLITREGFVGETENFPEC